jgi:hypothetical protein
VLLGRLSAAFCPTSFCVATAARLEQQIIDTAIHSLLLLLPLLLHALLLHFLHL